MGVTSLIALGIALAMDAACVSMVNGMVDKRIKVKKSIYIAFLFGFFQGGMALIGYLSGNLFVDMISGIDHWIALILLVIIGSKMIYESARKSNKDELSCFISNKKLFVQALATSIDALAAGISIAALAVNMTNAVIIIFTTTFSISFLSIYIGKRFGVLLNKKAELLGGLILIIIGLEIFITHVST
jgi:putative Mn2+ efflux pump MntP